MATIAFDFVNSQSTIPAEGG